MKYILAFCVLATAALMVMHQMDKKYAEGFAEGKKIVLNTNPPSEALEIACVSLWVGNENKKASKNDGK